MEQGAKRGLLSRERRWDNNNSNNYGKCERERKNDSKGDRRDEHRIMMQES